MFEKLHKKRGASLIIALVYLIIVLSIGSAILTMSLSNISRVKKQKEVENNYLAVSSAVELFKQKIGNIQIKKNWTDNEGDFRKNLLNDTKIDIKNNIIEKICDIGQNKEITPLQYEIKLDGLKTVKVSIDIYEDIYEQDPISIDSEEENTSDIEQIEQIKKNFKLVASFKIDSKNELDNYCITLEEKGLLNVIRVLDESENDEKQEEQEEQKVKIKKYSISVSINMITDSVDIYKGEYKRDVQESNNKN